MRATKANRDQAGFSLIELLVVIVVLGVLGAIVVFGVGTFRADTQAATDAANLKLLNNASAAFDVRAPAGGHLSELADDDARMRALVGAGLLEQVGEDGLVEPLAPGARFSWDAAARSWVLTTGTITSYDFAAMTASEFPKRVGTWTASAAGFTNSGGARLFWTNPRPEYTFTTRATLGPGTTSGYYGLVFNSTVAGIGSETGYVVQFDRGIWPGGGIVVNRRVNGANSGPTLATVPANPAIGIPTRSADPAWWTATHEVTLSVRNTGGSGRSASFAVDGRVVLADFAFSDPVDPATGYVGLLAYATASTFASARVAG